MVKVESGVAKTIAEGIVGVLVFPGSDGGRNFIQSLGIEAKRLAHFARRHTVSISNDIGRHGSAALAVTLVHVLDGSLALIAAGQVNIDIGPLAAFFGEEALEEQIHAHGIYRSYSQRVTDGAVCCRSAPLCQDALLAAEANNVPDNQKVASEIEFLDQRQFAFDLPTSTVPEFRRSTAIALLEAFPCALTEE